MNNSTNKILLIAVLVSLGLNVFLGIKLYQNRTTISDVEISYDAINPMDFQQGANVILAQGTSQYPHDALSYLLLVDNEGQIEKIYCLDGQYGAIAFNDQTGEVIVLGEKNVLRIGTSVTQEQDANPQFLSQQRSDIYFSRNRIYVNSQPVKDERLGFTPKLGYAGFVDLSSLGTDLHMMPVGVVIVSGK